MKITFNRRLSLLTIIIVIVGVLLFARLASFQFQLDMVAYLQNVANRGYTNVQDRIPERGSILDRNGELFAVNTTQYIIGVSPIYITDKEKAAQLLAKILNDDPRRILNLVNSSAQYELVTRQPVSVEIAQKVGNLSLLGVKIDAQPERIYPHNSLAAQVIGFYGWDGTARRGYTGIEGYYDKELAGQSRITEASTIPFDVNANDLPPPGKTIKLTLDRSIQYLAETELQDAITKYGAVSGSILIMDPRNGEVLAMASFPSFDPNTYYNASRDKIHNPIVSDTYEPGSVFKPVTLSVALRSGKVTPESTYIDVGCTRKYGGLNICDWNRAANGSQSVTDILVHSWNLGTSWLAYDVMGPDIFYKGLEDFGVGQRTGIDLEGEASGILRTPQNAAAYGGWSPPDLATNSFGQGLSVTPLQLLSFINTIANEGKMMQPHIRLETIDGNRRIPATPVVVRSPISPEIAHTIRDIMIKVVSDPQGEGIHARVPGYTIAGKTGTAQIPDPTQPNGYDLDLQNASFTGFLPADEPRVSILIKLDKVTGFASETAAPAFAKLVKRLVVLMNIPPDDERHKLQAQGGITALISTK